MKQAILYKKLTGKKVECTACSHRCKITEGKTGICGVRQNIKGKLYLLVYGRVVSANIDPIEKKPLYHFLPGSRSFSIGTFGCNFRCKNCQNFDISQIMGLKGQVEKYGQINWGIELAPKDIVLKAKENHCQSIAYTYNEPTIWAEYALEIMKIAKAAGLKNIWVSNGFMTDATFKMIAPYLDAINIDIKSYDDKFYRENCGAHLKEVLETCQRVVRKKIHLEVTTLIIPTLSDDEKMLRRLAHFIKTKLGAEVPWHISAFSGAISWKLQHLSDTSLEKLRKIYEIGKKEGLKNVYVGNVIADSLENTFCPKCHSVVIRRVGYNIKNMLKSDRCPNCNSKIAGIWQ